MPTSMGYAFIALYLLIILIVLRLSTILLVMTGMEPSQSSFQAASMLTGAGFTTSESELVLRHPVRRRIGLALILFGAFSLAVLVSVISSLISENSHISVLAAVAAVLACAWFLLRVPAANRRVAHWIASRVPSHTEAAPVPVEELADDQHQEDVMGVQIAADSPWLGLTLRQVLPEGEEIVPLAIKRDGRKIRKARWETPIEAGDFVLLYGEEEAIQASYRAISASEGAIKEEGG
ncbi:TrkA C-terminal domain-containing protein [Paenibacillus sp. D51F]